MIALAEAQLPSAPIWDIAEASNSAQAKARDLVQHGARPVVAQPVWFDGAKPAATAPAPDLGADAPGVLSEFCGIDAEMLAALRERGVVQ